MMPNQFPVLYWLSRRTPCNPRGRTAPVRCGRNDTDLTASSGRQWIVAPGTTHPALDSSRALLKEKLCADLHHPWIARERNRRVIEAAARRVHVVGRAGARVNNGVHLVDAPRDVLGMVEGVQELGIQFQSESLSNRNLFSHGEIQVINPRHLKSIAFRQQEPVIGLQRAWLGLNVLRGGVRSRVSHSIAGIAGPHLTAG